jgi:hypothetical protein
MNFFFYILSKLIRLIYYLIYYVFVRVEVEMNNKRHVNVFKYITYYSFTNVDYSVTDGRTLILNCKMNRQDTLINKE